MSNLNHLTKVSQALGNWTVHHIREICSKKIIPIENHWKFPLHHHPSIVYSRVVNFTDHEFPAEKFIDWLRHPTKPPFAPIGGSLIWQTWLRTGPINLRNPTWTDAVHQFGHSRAPFIVNVNKLRTHLYWRGHTYKSSLICSLDPKFIVILISVQIYSTWTNKNKRNLQNCNLRQKSSPPTQCWSRS